MSEKKPPLPGGFFCEIRQREGKNGNGVKSQRVLEPAVKTEIFHLNLLAPLHYTPEEGLAPFGYREDNGETLFCFELDKNQAGEFEPDKAKFPGNLVFSGRAIGEDNGELHQEERQRLIELPRGSYLFAQKREILSLQNIIDMAVAIQQEGLWQRLFLEEKLYLRYLFEDGCSVTQLFRPYAA